MQVQGFTRTFSLEEVMVLLSTVKLNVLVTRHTSSVATNVFRFIVLIMTMLVWAVIVAVLLMVEFDLLMEEVQLKDVWRFVVMTRGEQFVIMGHLGGQRKHMLFANS